MESFVFLELHGNLKINIEIEIKIETETEIMFFKADNSQKE
jgi:hypothetical protein